MQLENRLPSSEFQSPNRDIVELGTLVEQRVPCHLTFFNPKSPRLFEYVPLPLIENLPTSPVVDILPTLPVAPMKTSDLTESIVYEKIASLLEDIDATFLECEQ